MRSLIIYVLWLGSVFFSLTSAAASLSGRWGAGVSIHDFHTLPSLTLRYYPVARLATSFHLGFNTNDTNGATLVGAKAQHMVNIEENLNFYVGAGLFHLSERMGPGTSSSGLEMDALVGAEFFLPGLPNLGIQFETGIACRSVGSTTFRTIGSGFLGYGIYYYL